MNSKRIPDGFYSRLAFFTTATGRKRTTSYSSARISEFADQFPIQINFVFPIRGVFKGDGDTGFEGLKHLGAQYGRVAHAESGQVHPIDFSKDLDFILVLELVAGSRQISGDVKRDLDGIALGDEQIR